MKTKRKGAWVYHDTRRLKTDFVMMSKASIERAMEIKSRSTYRLWLYILHQVNGRTLERNPEGWILGESQLRERTGISRTALYDGMGELTSLGLISREKVGRTTHAFLSVASSESDSEDSDASSRLDALTATGTPKKTGNSEPVKKPQCVQPVGLLPILRDNSINSLNLSERETEKQAKSEDEIPEEFKAIALAELNAAYEHWAHENPMESGLTVDIKDRAWTSILYMLKKRNGIDMLHRKGYAMGRTRKKGELLRWLEVIAREWEERASSEGIAMVIGLERTAQLERPDLAAKYRETWKALFCRFGYRFEVLNKGHLKHNIFTGGSPTDKERAIAYWTKMVHCEQIAILDLKMELAIGEYGRAWFERGEF